MLSGGGGDGVGGRGAQYHDAIGGRGDATDIVRRGSRLRSNQRDSILHDGDDFGHLQHLVGAVQDLRRAAAIYLGAAAGAAGDSAGQLRNHAGDTGQLAECGRDLRGRAGLYRANGDRDGDGYRNSNSNCDRNSHCHGDRNGNAYTDGDADQHLMRRLFTCGAIHQ